MGGEFGFEHEQAEHQQSSAAPSQLIGNTDMAESPSRTIMAPATPGTNRPGELSSR